MQITRTLTGYWPNTNVALAKAVSTALNSSRHHSSHDRVRILVNHRWAGSADVVAVTYGSQNLEHMSDPDRVEDRTVSPFTGGFDRSFIDRPLTEHDRYSAAEASAVDRFVEQFSDTIMTDWDFDIDVDVDFNSNQTIDKPRASPPDPTPRPVPPKKPTSGPIDRYDFAGRDRAPVGDFNDRYSNYA